MTALVESEAPVRVQATVSAAVFVLLFVAGIALLGDVLGSFGDPDDVFIERYGDSWRRTGDIAGSLVLVLLGAAFVWHVDALRRAFAVERDSERVDWPLLTSAGFAFALLIAAAALATVPLAREIGDFFDERRPRLEGAETAVLASFGYVLVFGAGGLAAAACVLFTSLGLRRTAAPGWLLVGGYVVAAVLPLSVGAFIPFIALPAWVAVSATAVWFTRPNR